MSYSWKLQLKSCNKSYLWIALLAWGVLDLLCAMFCEIHADEAYYRLYGQYLAWGYFDHPPMVGLLTALSNMLVPAPAIATAGWALILKNLSVRLATVLLHMATVYIVWQTIDHSHHVADADKSERSGEPPSSRSEQGTKRSETFSTIERSETFSTIERNDFLRLLLVAASIPMFNAYGFITTPDAPLLFFAALFYYSYRRYLSIRSWSMVIPLAVSMAGMLYSKYMAVLVILFAVLGNLQLLRDGKAWTAVALAAILMLPHLWWQYSNGFPSFTYHLVSRSTHYQSLYSWEFIPNQWAAFNPLVWGLMLWVSWKQLRHGNAFERSLGMTLIGFQLFFALMTVRGHVEPHWTMVTSIPAILLLTEDSRIRKRGVAVTLAVFAALVIIVRVVLMLNILPEQTGLAGKQPKIEAIHAEAQDRPVVFDGSFQQPSLYRFYFGDKAVLVRNQNNRYTQFDLLHLEQQLIGKPACVRRLGKVYLTEHLSEEDLRD